MCVCVCVCYWLTMANAKLFQFFDKARKCIQNDCL